MKKRILGNKKKNTKKDVDFDLGNNSESGSD